jgi:superfamily I DNA/RNA helicase/RecB family exonuclease
MTTPPARAAHGRRDQPSPRRALPRVELVRPELRPARAPVLDPDQQAVVDHRGGPLLVLAGPGTGKTTTVVELVADRIRRRELEPEQVLVLTFSRRAAAALRERIAARVGATTSEPLARTFHSYAYGLLRRRAASVDRPAPRLLPTADVRRRVQELIAGSLDPAVRSGVRWPADLQLAVPTRGFAAEVADALGRVIERGTTPAELRRLATTFGRPAWRALGDFAHEYESVASLRELDEAGPYELDPASLVNEALSALRADPRLLRAERNARRLVVVDEFQDCDPAQLDLLELVAGSGGNLVAVGDPDQSIYAFRGSAASAVADFPDRFRTVRREPATVLALHVSRRSGARLLAASRSVAARLAVQPGGHRELRPAPGLSPGAAAVAVFGSAAQESDHIAGWLRAASARDGFAWSEMAVLTRTGEQAAVLRRSLRQADIPVTTADRDLPLVEQPAAAAFLDLVELATHEPADPVAELVVNRILAGPLCALDTVARRRVGRAAVDLAQQVDTQPDHLVAGPVQPLSATAVLGWSLLDPTGPTARKLAAVSTDLAHLFAGLAAARASVAAGSGPAQVCWALWAGLGRAAEWQAAALTGGADGERADRVIDGVLAVTEAVDDVLEEKPGTTVAVLLDDLAARTLAVGSGPAARTEDCVAVLTAHASKGLEWPVVAVVGVQDQVWPDTRTRGSLLEQRELVRVLDEPGAAPLPTAEAVVAEASAALAEERRLFYVAVTRASARLLVTAVDAADQTPSTFLDDLAPPAGVGPGAPTPVIEQVPAARRGDSTTVLDSRALVARLRREVCDPVSPRREVAAALLARLARADVRGADPRRWWGVPELTDPRPRVLPGDGTPVLSPSGLETLQDCPLRWFLTGRAGGDVPGGASAFAGTVIHALAERVAAGELAPETIGDEFDREVPELGLAPGWPGRRQEAKLRHAVDRLASWLDGHGDVGARAEVPFDIEVPTAAGPVRVRGKIDRVQTSPAGRVEVVDFKTGSSAKPAHAAESLQLGLYQLAVGLGGVDDVPAGTPLQGAQLVTLGSSGAQPAGFQRPIEPGDPPPWLGAALEVAGEVLRAGEFTARRSEACPRCAVRRVCPAQPEGQQVAL